MQQGEEDAKCHSESNNQTHSESNNDEGCEVCNGEEGAGQEKQNAKWKTTGKTTEHLKVYTYSRRNITGMMQTWTRTRKEQGMNKGTRTRKG
jgi:hypothetical protein